MSEFAILYEAVRAAAEEHLEVYDLPSSSSTGILASPRSAALRCYLGLKQDHGPKVPLALDLLLGPLCQRSGATVAEGTALLGLQISQEQTEVLVNLQSSVNVLDCVAGSRKTQLLLAILAKMLMAPLEFPNVAVFLTAPTEERVLKLYNVISLLGVDMALCCSTGGAQRLLEQQQCPPGLLCHVCLQCDHSTA